MPIDVIDEAAEVSPCIYCGHVVKARSVPPASDDAAWISIAEEHADGCEWVVTRAHRRDA